MNVPQSDWARGYRTDLEYTFGAYTFLNPDLLLMNCVLRGVKPSAPILSGGATDERGLVYCDLGCGQGLTTVLMAARDPGGQYFGVDYNGKMIANARALAAEANISNVQFFDESFSRLPELDIPACDVIVMHGIWSWIEAGLRHDILDFIKTRLKPGGICYVSYNCAVGRNDRPMRELLKLAERASRATGEARVQEGIALAMTLSKGGAKFFRQNPAAADRLAALPEKGTRYVTHEYLNESWFPYFFSDVSRDMAQAGLGYVGSTDLVWNRNDLSLPDEAQALMSRVASVEDIEFLKDMWAGNAFRKDLFIKGRSILTAAEQDALLAPLHFAAIRTADQLKPQFEVPVGIANLDPKLYQKIFDHILSRPISGAELSALAKQHGTTTAHVLEPLLIANYVGLCCPRGAGARVAMPLKRLEEALSSLNTKGHDINMVALPGLATATALMPLDYLIWQVSRTPCTDRAAAAFNAMKKMGRQVMQNGAVVNDESQAIALLRGTVALFDQHVQPVLSAGIEA